MNNTEFTKTNHGFSITSNLKKSPISLLPPEVIIEIFCNFDIVYLPRLKHVCSYWNKIITEILDIKLISRVTSEEDPKNDALIIFERWANGRKRFSVYKAPYILKNFISKPSLSKIFGSRMYTLTHCEDYKEVLELLKHHAIQGGTYRQSSKDVVGDVWRTVLALTGLNSKYSVDELRGKSFEDNVVKSFMEKYTWYFYRSDAMVGMYWDIGILALHPDNKTLSDLLADDHN